MSESVAFAVSTHASVEKTAFGHRSKMRRHGILTPVFCFLTTIVTSTASDSSTEGEAIPSILVAADWTRNLLCGQIEQAKEDRNEEKKDKT